MVCIECGIRPGRSRYRESERKNEKTGTRKCCGGLYVAYDQRIITQEMRENHQTKEIISWICIHQIQDERQDPIRYQEYARSETDRRSGDAPYPIDGG